MYTPADLKIRQDLLISAFLDEAFQNELTSVRLSIEAELKKFLEYLRSRLSPEQKIFDNVESRIKTLVSFQEKIFRKDYVISWDISEDPAENQELIAKRLPDLIGFRINCFFCQDEETIYKKLKEYSDVGKLPDFHLNFEEGTQQQNGHRINKVTGKFQEKYSFEIQIKAIMHNIWGEVEHKTIYKDRDYDPYTEDKKSITEEVFNILQASDRQLVTLFSKKNDRRRLINALFYEMTKEEVQARTGTMILGRHYDSFFRVFCDKIVEDQIQRRVGSDLMGAAYQRIPVAVDLSDGITTELRKRIREQFLRYDLMCQFHICSQIFALPDFDTFLQFLADYQLRYYGLKSEIMDGEDEFDDETAEHNSDAMELIYENILTNLDSKIRGRKKPKDGEKPAVSAQPAAAEELVIPETDADIDDDADDDDAWT